MPITMPRPRSEAFVTEFLRDALAVDALGVPELEARARAAGLLGERQSITNIKAFKRAKKLLGIRSRRTGFGARSQWLWEFAIDDPQGVGSRVGMDRGCRCQDRLHRAGQSLGERLH